MTPLVDVAVRGAVVVLLALVSTALLGRRSAALRHAILAAALFAAAAMPALRAIAPGWHVPALSGVLEEPTVPAEPMVMSLSNDGGPLPAGEPVSQSRRIATGTLILWIWLSGAALSLAVLVAGLLRLAWFSSCAERVREGRWVHAVAQVARSCGVKRRILLLRSPNPALLLTWGMVRPEIFLPAGTDDWTDERRRVVLAHELAHIRRGDWVVQVAAEAIRSLYWFNPLVWMACRRLRQESEHACDDAVLRGGIAGAEYAAHLLEVARSLHRWRAPWGLAPAMAQPSTLERRIRTMLDAQRIRTPLTRTTAVLIVLVVLLAAMPIAGFSRTADASPEQSGVGVAPAPPDTKPQPAPAAPPSAPVAPATVRPVSPAAPVTLAPPSSSPRAVVAAPAIPQVAVPASPASATALPASPVAVTPPRAVRPSAAPPASPGVAPRAVRPGMLPTPAAPATPLRVEPAPPAPTQGGAAAQTGDGYLAGTISDQTGARVPGVGVTLTNVKTGGALATVTDPAGQYQFALLPDGTYVLRAALPGFVTASADVTVRRNANERRDVMMRIGTVQERITVSSSASAGAVAEPIVRQRPVEPAAVEAVSRELIRQVNLAEAPVRPVQVGPPVRVGGHIRQPVKVKDVKPEYPASFVANGISGTVVAVGTIGLDGSVQNLNGASAHSELADATLAAVRQWRFQPTRLNGTPVETTIVVTVEFTID